MTRAVRVWALVAVWIACQAWLLQARWVNPDEGAHLMDARLAMEGLVPGVDYGARQPLYVYTYVPFLKVLGGGYVGGRVMPLLATLLGGWVIYLIGRRLWGQQVGAVAGLGYLFAPTIFINAAVVKTEPLTILLTALGVYGMVVHLQTGRWRPLALAGAAFGLGYYVRESALGGLLAAIVVVLCQAREGWGRLLRRLIVLSGGFWLVCALVVGAYATRLPLTTIVSNDGLFPLYKVAKALQGMTALPGIMDRGGDHAASFVAADAPAVYPTSQPWAARVGNLTDALRLNLPFVVGAAVAACLWIAWSLRRRDPRPSRAGTHLGLCVAFSWLGSLVLSYGYYIVQRGFFQFYFREILPPLTLLSAFSLLHLCRLAGWERSLWRLLALGAGIGAAIVGYQHTAHGNGIKLALLAAGAIVVIGVVKMLRKQVERRHALAFVGLAALVASGVLSASYGARRLTVAYDSVWSPQSVREVAGVITRCSAPQDEVLSGAVMWEFEARRRPFANISHPLTFLNSMGQATAEHIRARLSERLPKLIVLDGYTEKTYLRHLGELESLLREAYHIVGEVQGSKYPVRVYALVEDAETAGPRVAAGAQ